MKEKEKNERNYLNSIKKDTIEIMKMKKEIEKTSKKEIDKEIHLKTVLFKKFFILK